MLLRHPGHTWPHPLNFRGCKKFIFEQDLMLDRLLLSLVRSICTSISTPRIPTAAPSIAVSNTYPQDVLWQALLHHTYSSLRQRPRLEYMCPRQVRGDKKPPAAHYIHWYTLTSLSKAHDQSTRRLRESWSGIMGISRTLTT